MTVKELCVLLGARALTNETTLAREVKSGYACDLLSWVMAHGGEGMAWTTVQTHMNVIAVAALHEMSCVIIPEGALAAEDVVEKANEENIAILASEKSAFEIAGLMYLSGVR